VIEVTARSAAASDIRLFAFRVANAR
jgi:hypothetical protein